jgi:hypothetical protein
MWSLETTTTLIEIFAQLQLERQHGYPHYHEQEQDHPSRRASYIFVCSKDKEYLGKRGRQHLRLAVAAASVVAHWQPRLGASRLPVRRVGDSFLLADGGQLAEGDDIG